MEATSLRVALIDTYKDGEYLSTLDTPFTLEQAHRMSDSFNVGDGLEARVRQVELDASPPSAVGSSSVGATASDRLASTSLAPSKHWV